MEQGKESAGKENQEEQGEQGEGEKVQGQRRGVDAAAKGGARKGTRWEDNERVTT